MMAPTRLDQFPSVPGQGRYDWGQLLDGSPWELVAGQDFNGKSTTFATNARHQAMKRGGQVRVRHFRNEEPERLVLQFIAK
jgi:hypothetical protein